MNSDLCGFNSSLVNCERLWNFFQNMQALCFNSSLVNCERGRQEISRTLEILFQLLIGKLRTFFTSLLLFFLRSFQLLIGKLRTKRKPFWKQHKTYCFNSSLVNCELLLLLLLWLIWNTFQLLIGKLRTNQVIQQLNENETVSTPHW